MKPIMKIPGSRVKGSDVRAEETANRFEGASTGGVPAHERASETTLIFDESIGCYRWGVKGK